MGIEEIVKVSIVRGTKTISKAGFGVPMIMSSDALFTGVRSYTSLKSVEADFVTTTSVWKWANKIFAQEKKVKTLKIAPRTALVAQVNTLTVLNSTDGIFTVPINGVDYSFTAAGSTIAQIRTGLIAAINAATATHSVTAAAAVTAGEFTLTCVAGTGFTLGTVTVNLSNVATTANNGVKEDIITAENADNDWYALILTSRTAVDVMAAAELIESRRKLFFAASSDADIKNAVSNNLFAKLKAKSYARTVMFWSTDQANGPEAAFAGRCLPLDPGSETWKFKDLVGVVADKLTDTEVANLKLVNANIYRNFAGFSMTSEGQVAVGEFIDVIRFVDWLQAQIEEEVFTKMISVSKIPYTDNGIAIIENIVRQQLQRGINVGGLKSDPAPAVTVPKVADILPSIRATRTAPDINFTAQLQGAIHFVEISGIVSV